MVTKTKTVSTLARAARETRSIGLRFGDLRFVSDAGVPQSWELSDHILDSLETLAPGFVRE